MTYHGGGDANGTVEYDLVGVGFGPSNLALAVAARELAPTLTCLFLERNSEFAWHPGMLLPGSRLQISFLKDLVTPRDATSRYTFLNFLAQKGRLEQFINLRDFFPSRIEYCDYLRWVATDFSEQVRFQADVVRVSPLGPDLFQVHFRDSQTGQVSAVPARNVVAAPGGVPSLPAGADAADVIHSSEFLPRFVGRWPTGSRPSRVVLVGAGQSAGEIARYLLASYPSVEVHLVISGYALRPADSSPFVNEQFYSSGALSFYAQDAEVRARQFLDLRNSNYGVVEQDLLWDIYRAVAAEAAEGRRRFVVHSYSRLSRVESAPDGRTAIIANVFDHTEREIGCDEIVVATGYDWRLDEAVFGDLHAALDHDAVGRLALSESCRVSLRGGGEAGLYVQGLGEEAFGVGETLLSLLAFRSERIVSDIGARLAPDHRPPSQGDESGHGGDKPTSDRGSLYTLIARSGVGTLISTRDTGGPLLTQMPFELDRRHPPQGRLLGAMPSASLQMPRAGGERVTVLFVDPTVGAEDSPEAAGPESARRGPVRLDGHARVLASGDRRTRPGLELGAHEDHAAARAGGTVQDDAVAEAWPGSIAVEIEIESVTRVPGVGANGVVAPSARRAPTQRAAGPARPTGTAVNVVSSGPRSTAGG